MKVPAMRSIVTIVLALAVPLFGMVCSNDAAAQGLFETGAMTGGVGGTAAGGASGVGNALAGAMGSAVSAIGGATGGGSGGTFRSAGAADFSSADAAFGGGGATAAPAPAPAAAPAAAAPAAAAPVTMPATDFGAADAAFGLGAATTTAPTVSGAGDGGATVTEGGGLTPAEFEKQLSSFMRTKLGSLPPTIIQSLTFEQYEAYRRAKAEKHALSNGSYGTSNFIPRRQDALERVIQQAKDMQYSQAMIDAIAEMFRLKEYTDYDYDVRWGKDPSDYLRRYQAELKRRERMARDKKKFLDRLRGITDQGKGGVTTDKDPGFQGPGGGVLVDKDGNPIGPYKGTGDDGEFLKIIKQFEKATGLKADGGQIPPDVVASLEAAIHNAILDKLKAKGFNVAALNVFLHSMQEVKVIVIVTTADLPRSAIRATLRQVRNIIEVEVLTPKFKPLRLAQLSSFTILNEVDNHFYEHPVLYWQMQLAGWDSHGKRIAPTTPAVGERLPQAAPDQQADALLNDFLGN